jgi:hypothetical protein
MQWLFAEESFIARLHFGSNKKNAKISAAATVPSMPATLPNLFETKKIATKNKIGTNVLYSVLSKSGTNAAATTVEDAKPIVLCPKATYCLNAKSKRSTWCRKS